MRHKEVNRCWRQGDERVIKCFALFPITCRNKMITKVIIETRWLETVYIRQVYSADWGSLSVWKNKCFVTEKEYMTWKKEEAEALEIIW